MASHRAGAIRPGGYGKLYEHDGIEMTLAQWARVPEVAERGITATILHQRMEGGWSLEMALTTPIQPNNAILEGVDRDMRVRSERGGKITIYLDAASFRIAAETAKRMDRSLSWVVQRCLLASANSLKNP